MHYKETKYGFEWGSASMERYFSDHKKGWVTFNLETREDFQLTIPLNTVFDRHE